VPKKRKKSEFRTSQSTKSFPTSTLQLLDIGTRNPYIRIFRRLRWAACRLTTSSACDGILKEASTDNELRIKKQGRDGTHEHAFIIRRRRIPTYIVIVERRKSVKSFIRGLNETWKTRRTCTKLTSLRLVAKRVSNLEDLSVGSSIPEVSVNHMS